jgi:ergothioneine biosynthesis protein EgtB
MGDEMQTAKGDRQTGSMLPLEQRYHTTRGQSLTLAAPLGPEDQSVQAMPDTSPTKWHLAHVTWFFETFVLIPFQANYRPFKETFSFLFNSYYEAAGERYPRPNRGLITRPGSDEIVAYRAHVDAAMADLLCCPNATHAPEIATLVELGINHEQQHQELLLMDILNLFSHNPLRPAYRQPPADRQPPTYRQPIDPGPAPGPAAVNTRQPLSHWQTYEGGIYDIGHAGNGFAFDHEGPRHQALLRPFALAGALVTNGDWLAFMEDGGYQRAALWLSDGIACVRDNAWRSPLYWYQDDDNGPWFEMSLFGGQPLNLAAPVSHISYFEADAFARWAGKRLPTEAEWEVAASTLPVQGNTLGCDQLRALPAGAPHSGAQQFFGDLWEWTASAFTGYPGFSAPKGAVGEYNGKFMSGQMVLRGGACVTPDDHLRASYRNFFYPHQRWAFSGLRLAEDLS